MSKLLAAIPAVTKLIQTCSRTYGIVHRSQVATIHGKPGYLIWDYILANEITFLPADGGEIVSFLVSFSDKATKARWNELVERYGDEK